MRLFRGSVFRDQSGFMLIEVSIALILFGLILGPGFIAWRTHNTIRQNQITLQHQDLIFQALAHHLELHGCLPKASDLSSHTWGESPISGDMGKPGVVPYRILGLSARVAKDGFGHWMTYAVDPQMTVPGLQCQGDMCVQFLKTPSALDVIEQGHSVQKSMAAHHQKYHPLRFKEVFADDAQSLHFKERFNGIAVVLVSHGYSGWGAPKAPGMPRAPFPNHASKAARINGDDTLSFVVPDHEAASSANQCIVAWKTRSQIMAQAHLYCMDQLFLKKAPVLPSTKSYYSGGGGGGTMGFPKIITKKQ